MGLENNNNAMFLSIGDGKITKRVQQPTEKSVQRTTKEGKQINEEIYDAVGGVITNIKVHEHEQWGRFWNIYLQDGEQAFCLQMNYSGGYASAFLRCLPNIDLSKTVRLVPSMKIVDDKKKVSMFVMQEGQALKHYWNKDNPGDLPPLKKIKVKKQGKVTEQWDDNDTMEYLERYVTEKILPKLKPAAATNGIAHEEPITQDGAADGLPF